MLWQMYYATKQEKYKTAAEGVEKRLDVALEDFEGLHHDVGFMWLPSAVANYNMTGNKKSKSRGLHAANILAGRYNPHGKFIRAWNGDRVGWIIIDCMMNIPLLHWASNITNDPRFSYIAIDHADTAIKRLLRPDGSCNHIAILDPENGEMIEAPGGQGYESGSAWSRGQAWALYGFALSYYHTKDERYLDAAKKVAHYFIANISTTDYVPLVDFRAPEEPVMYDTTAGTCAACGLLEIADAVPEYQKRLYVNTAVNILKATDRRFCNWNSDEDAIVTNGMGQYHCEGRDYCIPIIYGDYYFIEAVLKLKDSDLRIW
jgi:unsaturated chondroitin disaccharide hydrolase